MDFSTLDNEQLLTLLKATMAEAMNRGLAMHRAAADVVLDAQEVAQIKAEAMERAAQAAAELERQRVKAQAEREAQAAVSEKRQVSEAEKIAANWKKRKAISVALDKWGISEDWQINCWSRGADIRVYVEGGGDRTYAWKMCLYITGNAYHPPNSLDIEAADRIDKKSPLATKEGRQKFKNFLAAINARWNGLKLTNREIAVYDGEPDERHLNAYLRALEIKQQEPVDV